jgi:transcription-repair coupling factor (superfamily II helicase)
MLPRLIEDFKNLPVYRALEGALPPRGTGINVGGLAGSSAAVLVAALAEDLPQRVLLVVTATPADAERWLADLTVLREAGARLYPQREALGEEEPHLEIAGERVETIAAMLAGEVRVVVTTVRASAERTRMPRAVTERRFTLGRGGAARPAEVVERLEAMGFERKPSVLDVAQFAVRGGIIDVYGFGMAAPARIEWWGDEIISVRQFDLESQRSEGEIEEVTILPGSSSVAAAPSQGDAQPAEPPVARQSLLELLPPDALLFVDRAVDAADVERLRQ